MKQLAINFLGPDFQTMASKVFWTFVQSFLAFIIMADRSDWSAALLDAAILAGVAGAIVPLTVYARSMAGPAVEVTATPKLND